MNWAIRLENVSKIYKTSYQFNSIDEYIKHYFTNIKGKERPKKDQVVALEDINLVIQKGEVWGIMGNNGMGKSTLLKILAKITRPTTGKIELNGKVTALLEVGTGFHQELSGRENIYLAGAILGMRRWEVRQKFDEIVEFAGVMKDIDRPVKHYSSGMYLRLAFSVAAHLQNDILLLDEVLAVGDTYFRKKCIQKAKESNKNRGKTILYVSHHLESFQNFCQQGLVLENGKKLFDGNIAEAIQKYTRSLTNIQELSQDMFDLSDKLHKDSKIGMIKIFSNNEPGNIIESGSSLKIQITIHQLHSFANLLFGFTIKNQQLQSILHVNNRQFGKILVQKSQNQKGALTFEIPQLLLFGEGIYFIDLYLGDRNETHEFVPQAIYFQLKDNDVYQSQELLNKQFNIYYQPDLKMSLEPEYE